MLIQTEVWLDEQVFPAADHADLPSTGLNMRICCGLEGWTRANCFLNADAETISVSCPETTPLAGTLDVGFNATDSQVGTICCMA